jgi:hypothetical protein
VGKNSLYPFYNDIHQQPNAFQPILGRRFQLTAALDFTRLA